jgi:glycolate oxidase
VEAIWQLRREFSYSLKATGLTKLNEDIVIPRSQLVELVSFCESMQQETGIPVACFGHSGDGNIHTNIMVLKDAEGRDIREPADALVNRLFDWVMNHGGSITGEHGIGLAKAPWFPRAIGAVAMDAHRALKAALDPTGILNPGKMGL